MMPKNYFEIVKSFRFSDWGVILLTCALVIGNTGIWPMPNISAQLAVSQSLLHVPFEDGNAHYIFLNYFEPLVFFAIGGKSLVQYIVFSLLVTLSFLLLFILWFSFYHGKHIALDKNKILAAITFPSFMIPFYWIGMDGMTLLLMLITMIMFQRKLVLIPSILLGLQHFEQGFISLSILILTIFIHSASVKKSNHQETLKRLMLTLLYVVVGKALLTGWLKFNDVGLAGNRNTYLTEHLNLYFSMWAKWWYLIPWTLIGIDWLLIFSHIKKTWPLLIAAFLTFLLTAVVGDQTRVGAIVLFPSIFYWIMMDKELWLHLNQRFVYLLICSYLLLPVIVVWGNPYGDLMKYDKKIIEQFFKTDIKTQHFDWLMPFRNNVDSDSDSNIPTPLLYPKARIELSHDNIIRCQFSKECVTKINVTNTGNETWFSQHRQDVQNTVNLSYHLETSSGKTILFDGLRTQLPHDIASGVRVPLTLNIPNNLSKGDYLVQIDLVQENVTWFKDKNPEKPSVTIKLEVY